MRTLRILYKCIEHYHSINNTQYIMVKYIKQILICLNTFAKIYKTSIIIIIIIIVLIIIITDELLPSTFYSFSCIRKSMAFA